MNTCEKCGIEVEENGLTTKCDAINCERDKASFDREVENQKAVMTLPLIERMSLNEMPECFGAQRSTIVALALLLMTSLRQNEELANALQMQGENVTKH